MDISLFKFLIIRMQSQKKSQITVFIIIGLLIMLSIGIVIIMINSNAPENQGIDNNFAQPVYSYIEDCFRDAAEPGIYLLAQNGGYIYSYNPIVVRSNQTIAYHYRNNKECGPDIQFMEDEISRFVADSVKLCVNDFQAFPSLDINDKDIDVKTTILDDGVNIVLDYPVQVSNGHATTTLAEHTISVGQPLGRIIKQKDDMIKTISDKIDLDQFSSYNLNVSILPVDKNTLIFSLSDENIGHDNHPLVFNFAVDISINSPPRLEFIPDFVIRTGETLTFYANATDEDDDSLVYFSDDPDIFDVNQMTGKVSFESDIKGTFEADICVKDTKDKDCQQVKIKVKDE